MIAIRERRPGLYVHASSKVDIYWFSKMRERERKVRTRAGGWMAEAVVGAGELMFR